MTKAEIGTVYREVILSHVHLGKRGWTEPKQSQKASPTLLYPLLTYFSTTWCTSQNTGGGLPRSYLVCIDSKYYRLGMPAGLLPKHSLGAFPFRNK
jgi:hypothetical protein